MKTVARPSTPGKTQLAAEQARRYHALGFNVIAQDAHKKPLGKWGTTPDWTANRQTLPNVHCMPWGRASGIAAVCGTVSGGLVCVDFDKQQDCQAVDQFLTALGLPDDYPWLVITPGGGWHVWLRAPHIPLNGTGKVDREGVQGGHIELRYEGVLATLPPSKHPSGKRYQFVGGSEPCEAPASVDPQLLLAAYDLVTMIPPAPERKPYTPPDLPSDANELAEVERRTRAAIANTLVKRGHKPGVYHCPQEHKAEGKDFLFSPEVDHPIGGCQGKHAGQLTRWVDLAAHLKIDVTAMARAVAEERRPSRPVHTTLYRFAHGLPYTLSKRLRNAHLKTTVKPQHPADLVWLCWNEMTDAELPADRPCSAGQFQTATEALGRALSRDTVERGLDQLRSWGVVEYCDFCDLATPDDQVARSRNSHNSEHLTRGKPARHVYRFLTLAQQLVNFERHYRYLLREASYSGIPDDVQPEWGDLSGEDLRLLDQARAPVYAQYADQREAAAAILDRQAAFLEKALERIDQGRYRAVTLPPGPIPNARAYRRALHAAWLEAGGGEQPEAYKAMFEVGCARTTLPALREGRSITIEHTGVLPIDELQPWQRDTGRVLAEYEDGTALVRLPSSEKSLDRATDDEKAAYEALRARQKARRDLPPQVNPETGEVMPDLNHPQTEALYKGEGQAIPDCIPPAYSDPFIRAQFAYTPGAEHILAHDAGSGDPYTPAELWRLLLERMRTMTFAAFSEPREAEPLAPVSRKTPDRAATVEKSTVDHAATGENSPDNQPATVERSTVEPTLPYLEDVAAIMHELAGRRR